MQESGIRVDNFFFNIKYFTTHPTIYSLSPTLVVKNKNQFQVNSAIHNINTRSSSDFYQPLSHLTVYLNGLLMWVLQYITVFQLKWNTCLITFINLNHLWEGLFSNIHFIHCKNISIIKQLYDIFIYVYMTGSIAIGCYQLCIFGMRETNK